MELKKRPGALVLDVDKAHLAYYFKDHKKKHRVELFWVPLGTTGKLQLLEVGFNRPLMTGVMAR